MCLYADMVCDYKIRLFVGVLGTCYASMTS